MSKGCVNPNFRLLKNGDISFAKATYVEGSDNSAYQSRYQRACGFVYDRGFRVFANAVGDIFADFISFEKSKVRGYKVTCIIKINEEDPNTKRKIADYIMTRFVDGNGELDLQGRKA